MWLGKFSSMLLASKEAECPSFHFILSSLKKNILYVWHLIPSIFLWLLFLIYAPFTNHVHYIRFACFQCVDCRFAYFLADVDVFLKQVVDCRPEGQKRCFLNFRGTLQPPPPHTPKLYDSKKPIICISVQLEFYWSLELVLGLETTRLSYYNVTTRLVDLVGLCWFKPNLSEKIC